MLKEIKRGSFDHNLAKNISHQLVGLFKKRRTIREYTGEKIDEEIIDNALHIAGSAPSGANKQPWLFCKVSDRELIRQIRILSEKEEEDFYVNKPNKKWINDLKHLHTNEDKKFLDNASHLIPIFYQNTENINGDKKKNYYAKESTGLAAGMLISALHLSGLATLTYTPKRMNYIKNILDIDPSYNAFMIVVVGISPEKVSVPVITKKSLEDISRSYS